MYKVLIVDDSYADAEGMSSLFPWKDWNCEIIGTASNGLTGYKMAIELKPDIILTDISMPVKDGLEMAKMIRLELDNVFFIFMSCFPSFDYAQSALKLQAFSYLLKPIKLEELYDAIIKIDKQIKRAADSELLNKKLLAQFHENSEILLENYLLNTLLGTIPSFSQANLFNIDKHAKYSMLIFNIEHTDENNPYLMLLHLKELCKQRFNNIYTINFETNKLVVLMRNFQASLSNSIIDIQKSFHAEFNNNVSVYVNEDGIEFTKIPDYFQKSIHLISNNLFEQSNQIIQLNEEALDEYATNTYIDIAMLHKELFDLLSKNKNVETFLDKYYTLTPHNSTYLKTISYMILCIINMYLMEQNHSLSTVFNNDENIWDKISSFHTVAGIRQWLFNLISAVLVFLDTAKADDKSIIIVKNIEKYINTHYSSYTALQDSASYQHISLNYANSLFKKHKNKTIFEYLVSCRINHAKEMLHNSNMRISEISAACGYSSNTYFSTAFKQCEGITPMQYREKIKKEEQ